MNVFLIVNRLYTTLIKKIFISPIMHQHNDDEDTTNVPPQTNDNPDKQSELNTNTFEIQTSCDTARDLAIAESSPSITLLPQANQTKTNVSKNQPENEKNDNNMAHLDCDIPVLTTSQQRKRIKSGLKMLLRQVSGSICTQEMAMVHILELIRLKNFWG
jgi:hypothetical protein